MKDPSLKGKKKKSTNFVRPVSFTFIWALNETSSPETDSQKALRNYSQEVRGEAHTYVILMKGFIQ